MSVRRSKAEGKRSLREMSGDEEEEEGEDTQEALEKKQKGEATCSSDDGVCQVDSCTADMSTAKYYHKRHRVCEIHAKAPLVSISGLNQRFCQQCSRFHELGEFDGAKRSCRRRLAGHNERRRKSAFEG